MDTTWPFRLTPSQTISRSMDSGHRLTFKADEENWFPEMEIRFGFA
jgi:hypothetical protein